MTKTKISFIAFFFSLFSFPALAQLSIENFVRGGIDDSEKLLHAYLNPYVTGLSQNFSAGWYNTANSHGTLGFDLTITTNVALVPLEERTFNIANLGLTNLVAKDPNITEGQTAAGSKDKLPVVLQVPDPLNPNQKINVTEFNFPGGTNISFVPFPTIKASIGIIKETELMLRYVPQIELGSDGKFGLWGVGIKHGLKQYIPILKRVPLWHFAIMAAYTRMDASNALNLAPETSGIVYAEHSLSDYTDQKAELMVSNLTSSLIASVNLPVLCVYAGVGYSAVNSNLKLKGDYPLTSIEGTDNTHADKGVSPGDKIVVRLTDPIDLKYESLSGMNATLGLRVKLMLVTFHIDFTQGKYSTATAGIGISFR